MRTSNRHREIYLALAMEDQQPQHIVARADVLTIAWSNGRLNELKG